MYYAGVSHIKGSVKICKPPAVQSSFSPVHPLDQLTIRSFFITMTPRTDNSVEEARNKTQLNCNNGTLFAKVSNFSVGEGGGGGGWKAMNFNFVHTFILCVA